jgi:hypothetical protein
MMYPPAKRTASGPLGGAVEPLLFTSFQASLAVRLSRGVPADPALRAASLRSVGWHGQ